MVRFISFVATLLVLFFTSGGGDRVAAADLNSLLKGDYAYSASELCLYQLADIPDSVGPRIANATMTYGGDGTGSITGTAFSGGIGANIGTFRYTVNADRSFIQTMTLFFPGQNYVGIVLHGRIGAGQKVLLLSSDGSNAEHYVDSTSGAVQVTLHCGRSGTAVAF